MNHLFNLYKTDLYKVLYHRVSDKSLIADFIQDSFIRFWHKRNQIDANQSPKSYLFRIAINLVNDYYRHHKIVTDYQQKAISPVVDPTNTVEQVYEIIDQLDTNLSTTFYLSKLAGMSYSEIAATLEISVKTVESRVSTVLKIVREKIHE